MKTALLVIDVTPAFMPGGDLPVAGGDGVVEPVLRLILEGDFDEIADIHEEHPAGHVSFASAHGKKPYETTTADGKPCTLWPDHALAGTERARLHPAIARDRITFTFLTGIRPDVECFGAFAYEDGVTTGLGDELARRGVDKLAIVGLATDYCVAETAVQAAEKGYDTTIVLDACRCVNHDNAARIRSRLQAAGVKIALTVDDYLKSR
jgi:nicotinamidase/pyrazinamidase